MSIVYTLDENEFYALHFAQEAEGIRVKFVGEQDRCSARMLQAFFFEYKGQKQGFEGRDELLLLDDISYTYSLKLDNTVNDIELRKFVYKDRKFDHVPYTGRKLGVFDTRQLARDGDFRVLADIPASGPIPSPITDLHTHISAATTGEQLVRIGLILSREKPIYYPVAMLDRYNIPYVAEHIVDNLSFPPFKELKTNDPRGIALHHLSSEALNKLARAMEIGPAARITFTEMEACYDVRMPISKERDAFAPTLRELAEDYRQQKIQYVQLSSTAITRPDWLEIAHQVLPDLEAKTKIRFLAGLWRHAPEEELLDNIAALKRVGMSPYIVGVDIIGHETNPTPMWVLESIVEWSKEHRPDWVFQVHAGENPHIADNVLNALKFADKHGIRLQIGHGIYGVTHERLVLQTKLAERGLLMMTSQPDSNLALNNIDHGKELLLHINSSVPHVLCSDGHGFYRTNAIQTAMAAMIGGLNSSELILRRTTEENYIDRQQAEFKIRLAAFPDNFFQNLPPLGKTHNTPEVIAQRRRDFENHYVTLLASMKDKGIETNPEKISEALAGRTPLQIQGSSRNAWEYMSPGNRLEVRIAMAMLAVVVNQETTYFLSGGTRKGVEGVLFEEIYKRDQRLPRKKGHTVFGRITPEAEIHEIMPHTLTHGEVLGEKWTDLPAANVQHCLKNKGIGIFIGGGMFLRDTILYASNVDLPFGLMNGPEGASTKLAGEYPDGAFIGAVGMIKWLHQQRPDLLRPDFDINTVDELYLKVSGDVMNRQKNAERPLEVATSIIMVAHDLAAHRHDNHVALVFDRRNNRDRGLLSPGGLLALEEGETLMDAIKRKAQQNLGTIINIEGNSFIPLAPYIDKETDPSRAVLVTPYVMVLEPDQLRKTKEHIQRAKTDPEYWQDFAVKTNNETDWLVLKSVRELASGNFIFRHERDNYAAVLQLKATSRGAFR